MANFFLNFLRLHLSPRYHKEYVSVVSPTMQIKSAPINKFLIEEIIFCDEYKLSGMRMQHSDASVRKLLKVL